MNALAKTVEKITIQRRSRGKNLRKRIDSLRRIITAKSGNWNGTDIIRDARDAN